MTDPERPRTERGRELIRAASLWPMDQPVSRAKLLAVLEADVPRIEAEAATLAAPAGLPSDDALNDAYRERNALVAALARVGGYSARITPAPDAFGWSIVYLDTPAGQMSWHIGPNDLDLFPETVAAWVESVEWDGHTTPEKYERLAALEAAPRSPEPFAWCESCGYAHPIGDPDCIDAASPETPEPAPGLDDLRALSEAATPGPWEWFWEDGPDGVPTLESTGTDGDPHVITGHQCDACRQRGHFCLGGSPENRAFIAAAANYVRVRLSSREEGERP